MTAKARIRKLKKRRDKEAREAKNGTQVPNNKKSSEKDSAGDSR